MNKSGSETQVKKASHLAQRGAPVSIELVAFRAFYEAYGIDIDRLMKIVNPATRELVKQYTFEIRAYHDTAVISFQTKNIMRYFVFLALYFFLLSASFPDKYALLLILLVASIAYMKHTPHIASPPPLKTLRPDRILMARLLAELADTVYRLEHREQQDMRRGLLSLPDPRKPRGGTIANVLMRFVQQYDDTLRKLQFYPGEISADNAGLTPHQAVAVRLVVLEFVADLLREDELAEPADGDNHR